MNTPLVNHVTRVTINLAAFMTLSIDIQSDFSSNQIRIWGSDVNNRLQKLADVLEQLSTIGFSLSWEKVYYLLIHGRIVRQRQRSFCLSMV